MSCTYIHNTCVFPIHYQAEKKIFTAEELAAINEVASAATIGAVPDFLDSRKKVCSWAHHRVETIVAGSSLCPEGMKEACRIKGRLVSAKYVAAS